MGNDIGLSAQGEDVEGDTISYEWSATGGSIADASAPQTTYTCGAVGKHSITITVSDDDGVYCTDEWTVPVTCVDGDGGTGGAGGDGGGTGGTGGTAPPCDGPACLFCPASALDPTVGALFPDGLLLPIDFTAVPDQPLVQGATESVTMSATSFLGPLPVSVVATLSAASNTTYDVVAGGSGTADVPVPVQTVEGTTLMIDAGTGAGAFTPDSDATDVVVRLTSAVFDMTVTDPLTLPLLLDASPTGECVMLGDGVSLMVTAP